MFQRAARRRAMIVIIHGYGKTDFAGRTLILRLRSRFTQLGISTLIWTSPVRESKGTFDADQPVESSAREVLDAIRHAREASCRVTKVGLWASARRMDRATGDHARSPKLVLAFGEWHDDKENFPYLLDPICASRDERSGNQTLAW